MNRYFRFYTMEIETREAVLDRMERLTEVPLLLLSFIMIPLLLGPMLWDLSATEDLVFSTLDNPGAREAYRGRGPRAASTPASMAASALGMA